MLTHALLLSLLAFQPQAPTPTATPKPATSTPAAPAAPAPKAAEPEKKPDAPKDEKPKEDKKEEKVDPYVLGFKMKDVDGKEQDLSQYKGKVVLMVNVASRCGYTPQYKGLEELYQSKKGKGFVILAFPANNFAGQEPGSDSEIKEFCTGEKSEYKVTFPIFSKVSVKGKDQCDLYKKLAAQPAPVGGDPKWNFHKFLVDRNGNVVARFDSKVDPKDADLARKIDELLGAEKKDDKKPETKK